MALADSKLSPIIIHQIRIDDYIGVSCCEKLDSNFIFWFNCDVCERMRQRHPNSPHNTSTGPAYFSIFLYRWLRTLSKNGTRR